MSIIVWKVFWPTFSAIHAGANLFSFFITMRFWFFFCTRMTGTSDNLGSHSPALALWNRKSPSVQPGILLTPTPGQKTLKTRRSDFKFWIYSNDRFLMTALGLGPGKKLININRSRGLSQDWVGWKILFVFFWGHSLWGETHTHTHTHSHSHTHTHTRKQSNKIHFHAQYDWTTGVPDNEWMEEVPRPLYLVCALLRSLALHFVD